MSDFDRYEHNVKKVSCSSYKDDRDEFAYSCTMIGPHGIYRENVDSVAMVEFKDAAESDSGSRGDGFLTRAEFEETVSCGIRHEGPDDDPVRLIACSEEMIR